MRLAVPSWISGRLWRRRWEQAKEKAAGTPLEIYYRASPPAEDVELDEVAIIALDFESDGLGEDAALLEAGWVGMDLASIDLSTARRERIRARDALQETAVTIHQITDSQAAKGRPEKDVVDELVEKLAGKIILAHFAQIEAGFLNAVCQRQYDAPFVGHFVCTMQLEQRWFPKERAADGLRLGKLRAAYGLPQYRAHDGLTDAIACAELFLAQLARSGAKDLKLSDILMRG